MIAELLNGATWGGPRLGLAAATAQTALFRYRLWRTLSMTNARRVLFVALNPSTADDRVDDPTIRREIAFAKRDGFGVLEKVNLFAFRSTDPELLTVKVRDDGHGSIVGPENDDAIREAAARADRVVCAWGSSKILATPSGRARVAHVVDDLLAGRDLYVFAPVGKALQPRHPLYLPGDCPVAIWRAASASSATSTPRGDAR